MVHSLLQKMSHKLQKMSHECWVTRIGDMICPVDMSTLSCMMSSVTFDFSMAPRPSHGPFPWPGQPNSTHTILRHSVWWSGLSDKNLRFSFDLKCVSLPVCCSHDQGVSSMRSPFCVHVRDRLLTLTSFDLCRTLDNHIMKAKSVSLVPYHSLHVRVTI